MHVKQVSFFENNGKQFRILHQNIASVLAKKDQVEIVLSELSESGIELDVICLTETFVKRGDEKNIIFNDFELASSYSRRTKRGGACILVKKGTDCKNVMSINQLSEVNVFEICAVRIPAIN
jgi:hypothetical protein